MSQYKIKMLKVGLYLKAPRITAATQNSPMTFKERRVKVSRGGGGSKKSQGTVCQPNTLDMANLQRPVRCRSFQERKAHDQPKNMIVSCRRTVPNVI